MDVQALIDDAHPIAEFSQKWRVCLLLVSLPSTDITYLQVLALQDGLRAHRNPRYFLDRALQEVRNGGSFHHLRWMLILYLLVPSVYLMGIEGSGLNDDLGLLERLLWNVVGVVINHLCYINCFSFRKSRGIHTIGFYSKIIIWRFAGLPIIMGRFRICRDWMCTCRDWLRRVRKGYWIGRKDICLVLFLGYWCMRWSLFCSESHRFPLFLGTVCDQRCNCNLSYLRQSHNFY